MNRAGRAKGYDSLAWKGWESGPQLDGTDEFPSWSSSVLFQDQMKMKVQVENGYHFPWFFQVWHGLSNQ